MNGAMPSWVEQVEGFDPAQRWLPIVCSDGGEHPLVLIGLVYAKAGDSDDQHLFIWDYLREGVGFPESVRSTAEERAAARAGSTRYTWRTSVGSFHRMGSWTIHCERCSRTPRFMVGDLHELLERAWDLAVPMVDVSTY